MVIDLGPIEAKAAAITDHLLNRHVSFKFKLLEAANGDEKFLCFLAIKASLHAEKAKGYDGDDEDEEDLEDDDETADEGDDFTD